MNVMSEEEINSDVMETLEIGSGKEIKEKAYSVDELRLKHKDAYKPWTADLDIELTRMYLEGINTRDMAKHFGRTRGSISSRIKKLQLEEAIEEQN